jgi:hypothetical protein
MAGYTRQSTFADGDTITAALFNNEYNQLLNAFSNTSGHKHDGTANEGPVIGLIGDAGVVTPLNKVLIDSTNDHIEFWIEVSSSAVQQLYIADGAIVPVTDSDVDLGTTSLRFKDTYTDTITTTGNATIGGNLTVTGNATISGNLTFGDADTDSINLAAEIDSDIIPNTDGTYDLGSSTKEWQDLFIDGTANIDSLIADTADINGGTIDGATIATSDITVGSGKTLNVSAGTLTLADNQISGDKVEGGTIAATTITTLASTTGNITTVNSTTTNATTVDSTNLEVTNLKAKDGTAAGSIANSTGVVTLGSSVLTTTDINGGTIDGSTIATSDITVGTGKTLDVSSGTLTLADNQISGDKVEGGTIAATTITALTYGSLNDGTITITAFVDEDDMSSDSATLVPTQQSVKAYVDSQVTAQDLDFLGDSGGALSIDLDSESLTIAGGTGLDTVGSGNTVTVNIDSTVATLTGTQTLTNKTLTSPDVNTPDIDGGTIDSTVIGGATPAAGTFTTLTANTSLTGTLATAAQPNITSVGTLTGFTSTGIDDNATSTAITIDSSENVGIGTSSPAEKLDVIVDATGGLKLGTNADAGVTLTSYQGSTNSNVRTIDFNAQNFVVNTGSPTGTAVSEAFRITNDGNVGIGTSSPASATGYTVLTLNNATNGGNLQFHHNGTYKGVIYNSSSQFRIEAGASTPMVFANPNGEAMRIDSSGNLLVGTTDTAPGVADTNVGVALNSGRVFASAEADYALNLNRNTNDGDIVRFRKDGTTVGSLGVIHGNNLFIGAPSHSGLQFGTSVVYPTGGSTGDANDATLDIGASGQRFKDLYLSGNTYVGNAVTSSTDGSSDLKLEGNQHIFRKGVAGSYAERMRIDSSGNVGVGTTSPSSYFSPNLVVHSSANLGGITIRSNATTDTNYLLFADGTTGNERYRGYVSYDHNADTMKLATGASPAITIDSSGNVGIGDTSPDRKLHVNSGNTNECALFESTDTEVAIELKDTTGTAIIKSRNDFRFTAGGSERMRIDSSGNLLVGKTGLAIGTVGTEVRNNGQLLVTANGDNPLDLNRLTSDGTIANFRKDGLTIGSISATATGGGSIIIGNDSSGIMFRGDLTSSAFIPADPSTGNQVDNSLDVGHNAVRFDDIYATNGTIQTSDRNEKQDIAELTDAETRVAVAAKGLLRKFRWIDSVEEKGDEARTHFGIIAQDLQDAFTAEGLDAGDYAMFISSTWTNDDGEEQTRLGVRYSELLAFIIAAI